jgi:glutamate-1-semialdehyde aminotransferase
MPPATDPDVSRSLAYYGQAESLIPGWTQLISRRADQFAHGVSPIYAQRAKGSRFIDVDENEYIDWVNAVGAVILGHAHAVVDGAVKAQIDRGSLDLPDPSLRPQVATLFIQEMARHGVHCNLTFKATLAHTETDIRVTGQAASEALTLIRQGLEAGDLSRLLRVDLKKEPFRRLVR